MENRTETKGFYDYRNTLRALSDGFSLMNKSAMMLFKVFWPLLLLLSLAGGWCAAVSMQFTNTLMTDAVPSLAAIGGKVGIPFGMFLLFTLLFNAAFYEVFSLYVEKGFIPALTMRSVWKPILKKTRRLLLVYIWILFLVCFYAALSYYLAYLSRWTLIVTVPVCLFLGVWFLNKTVAFLVEKGSLWSAVRRSLVITAKGFGSFLATVVLLSIIEMGLGLLFTLPSNVSELINYKMQVSVMEGDEAALPGYFMPIYFASRALSVCLCSVLSIIVTSCWCMVYGAVAARLRQKRGANQ